MKFHIESTLSPQSLRRVDAVLLPVWIDAKNHVAAYGAVHAHLTTQDQRLISAYLRDQAPKKGEAHLLRLTAAPTYVFLVAAESFTERSLAIAVRRFVRNIKHVGLTVSLVHVDDFERDNIDLVRAGALVAENAVLAHYDFSEQYKTPPADGWKAVKSFVLSTMSDVRTLREEVAHAETLAQCVNKCRTLANYPPSELKPEGIAEAARTAAATVKGLKVTVFDEKKLKAEGMNAILAVGAGSGSPPRLVMIEYSGGMKGARPLALVGKGITFDSGGLNIKPGEGMSDMHMDMSGGAAVIYAIEAIAALKLPINVVGFVPAAENMISGLSYRQGDIVKSYGGMTIEIANTDAEGRVVLADAIAYAKTKKPLLIAEISTLTGAAEVALGQRVAALFVKNNTPLQSALQAIGEQCGDRVWPLPLWDEHEKDVEGHLADLTNLHRTGSRWGGAITGAAFLSKIAGQVPFAHIDMAPRMLTLPDEEQLSRGAAGFGVRYFVELARQWSEVQKLLKA